MKNKTNLEIDEEMHKRIFDAVEKQLEKICILEVEKIMLGESKIIPTGLLSAGQGDCISESEIREGLKSFLNDATPSVDVALKAVKDNGLIYDAKCQFAPPVHVTPFSVSTRWDTKIKKPDYKRIDVHDGKCIHDISVNEPCDLCEKNIPF